MSHDNREPGTGSDAITPPRPGPDALYGSTPTPPQLENGAGWSADPLLVAGCDAYVDGEYLYQDYIYDDRGADTRSWASASPTDASAIGGILSQPTGDYHYPNNPERYAYNAADLLEFRVRLADDGEGVVYRFSLNTMLAPDAAAVAVGIDTDPDEDGTETTWGYGLGTLGVPLDHRLVTWGTGAEFDGERLGDDRVSVDVERNQIEVAVPVVPDGETWRHYCVVGLWNDEIHEFKQINPNPDDEMPGGGKKGQNQPPVFNVGFRFDEPFNKNISPIDIGRGLFDLLDITGIGHSILELLFDKAPRTFGQGNWCEHRQATALADRDISPFHADIDFEKLHAEIDERHIPESGFLSFLYPSRYYLGEGVDVENDMLEGRIQPYNVYIPDDIVEPAPLILLLHSLSCNYTQYAVYMPNLVRQLADETGALVLMPQARGPGRWYKREGELDVFEAWRHLETRFNIDRSRVSLGGYSMGGFGTCMLAAQCPDLFGRGFSIVGPATEDPIEGLTNGLLHTPDRLTTGLFGGDGGGNFLNVFTETPESSLQITANLRHVPLLIWNTLGDPLVPVLTPENYARRLKQHGYRYQYDLFPAGTHLSLGLRDQWDGIPSFVSQSRVIRTPRRVTYRQVPQLDYPEVGLVHDGAYWVSDIETRDDRKAGTVDAISLADGYADPQPDTFKTFQTTPKWHLSRGVQWQSSNIDERHDPANELQVTLDGVATATLWVEEAGLDIDDEITVDVDSDAPATLILASTHGHLELKIPAGQTTKKVLLEEQSGDTGTASAA